MVASIFEVMLVGCENTLRAYCPRHKQAGGADLPDVLLGLVLEEEGQVGVQHVAAQGSLPLHGNGEAGSVGHEEGLAAADCPARLPVLELQPTEDLSEDGEAKVRNILFERISMLLRLWL